MIALLQEADAARFLSQSLSQILGRMFKAAQRRPLTFEHRDLHDLMGRCGCVLDSVEEASGGAVDRARMATLFSSLAISGCSTLMEMLLDALLTNQWQRPATMPPPAPESLQDRGWQREQPTAVDVMLRAQVSTAEYVHAAAAAGLLAKLVSRECP
eukprot:SAG11_NODE_5593_length_1515_cov_1.242938_1_plen_156_part_00